MSFLRRLLTNTSVPQTQRQLPDEVRNNAGGFVYSVDRWARLERFLVIGTQGGTYYVAQDALTAENAEVIEQCLAEDAIRTVRTAVDVSQAARAVKQDYAIFVIALALASKDPAAREAAYAAIGHVCRTASTLFQLLAYLQDRRGWSRGLRTAIARWYDDLPLDRLAYQMVKYRNRNGFTHRDVLRLAHPHAEDEARSALYAWAVGKDAAAPLPDIVRTYEATQGGGEVDRARFARALPREALPTEWLTDATVWEALLYGEDGKGMPLTALIRNLGNLSKCGLLVPGSNAAAFVSSALTDRERLLAARVHPIAIFAAQKQYAAGRGLRGAGAWTPVGAVLDALSAAFPLSFGNVTPTGKRLHVALDVSGSMTHAHVAGMENCRAFEVAAAMAMVHANVEPHGNVTYSAFDTTTKRFVVAKDDTLERVAGRIAKFAGGGTDLSLAVTAAREDAVTADAIVIYTDSETWAGCGHLMPHFDKFRADRNRNAKLAICSTTATELSAGPKRDDVLQACGFDTTVPTVLAQFLTN